MKPVETVGKSDEMVAYQKAQNAAVIASVRKVLTAMEAEIDEAGGRPHGIKICRAEVCRRAGIGQSTLKNPSHNETRAFVGKTLARLKALGKQGRKAHPVETQSAVSRDPRADTNKNLAIQLDAAIRELEAATRERDAANRERDAVKAELKQARSALDMLIQKGASEQGSAEAA